MNSVPSRNRGFGLVELMVSIVPGLVVSGAAVAFVMSTLTSNTNFVRAARFNEDLPKRARKLVLVGDQVGLTDTQKARLNQIFVTARNQATALFTNRQLPEEQRAVSVKRLYETLEQQILATLTPEQQKILFGENQKPNGKE